MVHWAQDFRLPSLGRSTFDSASVLLLLTLLGACESIEPSRFGEETRDSAGILIVETPEPTEEWQLATTPDLRVGVVEGDPAYQLHGVRYAVRLGEGTLVVFDGGSREVRFFDETGRLSHSVGGQGQGPGEFQSFSTVVLRADTLIVQDSGNRRLTVITPDGRIGKEHPVMGFPAFSSSSRLLGLSAGGHALVLVTRAIRPPAQTGYSYKRDSVAILRVNLESGQADTLAHVPGDESTQWASGSGPTMRFMDDAGLPFGHSVHVAARGEQVLLGSTEDDQIMVIGPDGGIARIIRRKSRFPILVSADIRDSYRKGILEGAQDRGETDLRQLGEAIEDQLALVPKSHAVPGFDALMVDAIGRIWIRQYQALPRTVSSRTWEVFESDGVALARLQIPNGISVLHIGASHITARVRDSLDVEYVEVWAFAKNQ